MAGSTWHPLIRYLCTAGMALAAGLSWGGERFFIGDKFSHPLPGGGNGPEMIVLREGKFVFGGGRLDENEEDLVIEIARPFAISLTEITVGMYRQFLRATRSVDLQSLEGLGDDLPVAGISWDQAESYVAWLSHHTGFHYSLPSSTQWEYAARAGSIKTYSWGDQVGEKRANCMECGGAWQGDLAPVASFEANNWGLFDVHGNVWEWTRDCVDANSKPPLNGMPQLFGNCDLRELRGGSARSDAWSVRTNSRALAERKARSPDVGLRVVMEIPPQR